MNSFHLPRTVAVFLVLVTCFSQTSQSQENTSNTQGKEASSKTKLKVVNALIYAFNEHDPKKMTSHVDQAIELYYVDDNGKSEKALDTSSALEKEMTGYFRAFPDVRSTVKGSTVVGRFVSVHERVEWTRKGKKTSQYSLAVYEIRNEKIRRVWYYPAQR